ncbi:MAG: MBL fold metallo-hydrolase [Oscillospiraceae bacterium]|nr:MBL fold metallo-hydrolase [Oscillospiraceae bacterium]
MKLTFLGATHEVTGSCTLIEINGKYGVVDCGMEQGEDIFVNQELPVAASQLDFVLLTHAHIDHSGNIPLLFKQGYSGPVYATRATCHLCEIMLRDSAHIQESDAEWKTRKAMRAGGEAVEPIYTMLDAETAIAHLRPVDYNKAVQIAEDVFVRFIDAGHLMGSASIEVWLTENEVSRKLVFSGDIGNFNQPLINDPKYIEEADFVITESTYGDRYHERTEANSVELLARCIQRTFDRGGNVVIPSFAVGRTQEMLYFIREIKVNGLVTGHGDFPVYVDSPLANQATAIFLQCDKQYFDEQAREFLAQGINPLMSPGVQLSVSTEESRAINLNKDPKVIISASGMCDAGRILHHLKHNLWRKESLILFVGYQAAGTIGRKIRDGAKSIKLLNEEITVNAEISYLPGKSGHADKDGLIQWITAFKEKPKMVFVNHGEDNACQNYAACLRDEYGFTTSAPHSGSVFDLLKCEYVELTEGIPIVKEKAKAARASAAYENVIRACERLMDIARGCRGIPNKELSRFAGQILSLASKWEGWVKFGRK